MEQLLRNDGCIIFKWWKQAVQECPEDKVPLLVFKKNNHPFYCMFESLYCIPGFLEDSTIRHFKLPLDSKVTDSCNTMVTILTLDDFFRSEPDKWRERKISLQKTLHSLNADLPM